MFKKIFNSAVSFAQRGYHKAKQYAPIVNGTINSAKTFVTKYGGHARNVLNRIRQGASAFSVTPGVGGAIARGVALGADALHRGVSKAESIIPDVTRWQEQLGLHTGGFSSNRSRPSYASAPVSREVSIRRGNVPPPPSYRAVPIRV